MRKQDKCEGEKTQENTFKIQEISSWKLSFRNGNEALKICLETLKKSCRKQP